MQRRADTPSFRSREPRILGIAGLMRRALPPRPRVRYTRKSTRGEHRQAHSHEQQNEAMDREWGPLELPLWFRDSHTGTTFDRLGMNEMLTFCAGNPQPHAEPGIVEIYDAARFGRPLSPDGDEDVFLFLAVLRAFWEYGWRVVFIDLRLTGAVLQDAMLLVAHAYMASSFSAKLSRDVARGKRDHAKSGRWIHGRPPFPTRRHDEELGRDLADGEEARPGANGTVLRISDEMASVWTGCAQKFIAGYSFEAVAEHLHANNVTPAGKGNGKGPGRWGHSQVTNMLTNPVLIGMIWSPFIDPADGLAKRVLIRAQWGPLVDVDLYNAVQLEVERRRASPRNRQRRSREERLLTPRCAACGIEYHGGRLSKAQDRTRLYVHPKPIERMDPEQYRRTLAAGCKLWCVHAALLEEGCRDLITRERSTPEFEHAIHALLVSQRGLERELADAVREADASVQALTAQLEAAVDLQIDAKASGLDPALYGRSIAALKLKISQAERGSADARARAASTDAEWRRRQAMIHETRSLLKVWSRLDAVDRRRVFDEWVYEVLIVATPSPGRRRHNTKSALVFLKTGPFNGLELTLDTVAPNAIELPSVGRSTTRAADVTSIP